ncbi:hypothetical protein A2155_01815 [candidate division WWE3 bacterium RBG_16_52_45]|nr:MAG: hypothetical protein A2155_01815 [candidate division WWE3 bacterium RBG_16_52_45]
MSVCPAACGAPKLQVPLLPTREKSASRLISPFYFLTNDVALATAFCGASPTAGASNLYNLTKLGKYFSLFFFPSILSAKGGQDLCQLTTKLQGPIIKNTALPTALFARGTRAAPAACGAGRSSWGTHDEAPLAAGTAGFARSGSPFDSLLTVANLRKSPRPAGAPRPRMKSSLAKPTFASFFYDLTSALA